MNNRHRSLADHQARSILLRLAAGERGRDLAVEFGVSEMTISNVRTGRTYSHLPRSGRITSRVSPPSTARRDYAESRFWSKVDMSAGTDSCWPWLGTKLANGYGTTGLPLPGGTTSFRVAYHLANGVEVGRSLVVRHLCGWKPCCNPGHLALGSKSENYADGRAQVSTARSGRPVAHPVLPPSGSWSIQPHDSVALRAAQRDARAEEFWNNVLRGDAESCWLWTGAGSRSATGHGNFRWDGRCTSTGRVAYELEHGPIPPGLVVRHDCDTGACCNPHHLRLGTALDNRRDAQSRGRIPCGEAHHIGRRTLDGTVRSARERYFAGGESLTSLAAELGVSIQAVSCWVRGRTRLGAGGPIAQRAGEF